MKKFIKGYLLGLLSAVIILTSIPVFAGDILSKISVTLNQINISVNGKQVARVGENYILPSGEKIPYSILYAGTTYLPMRKMGELTGKNIAWKSATLTAELNDPSYVAPTTLPITQPAKLWEVQTHSNGNEVMITKYLGTEKSVVIPESIDGKSVTKIGDNAFLDAKTIESITIPDSITEIGKWAFARSNLKYISIPSSVKTIGKEAFWECENLTKAILPSDMNSIGIYLFYKCENLIEVKLPDNLLEIGEGLFFGCKKLQYVNIPPSVKQISFFAFKDSSGLDKIILNQGLERISKEAFKYCSNLKSISLPNSIGYIGEESFSNTALTEIVIPNNNEFAITVRDDAFWNCKDLTSVIILEAPPFLIEPLSSVFTFSMGRPITRNSKDGNLGILLSNFCVSQDQLNSYLNGVGNQHLLGSNGHYQRKIDTFMVWEKIN